MDKLNNEDLKKIYKKERIFSVTLAIVLALTLLFEFFNSKIFLMKYTLAAYLLISWFHDLYIYKKYDIYYFPPAEYVSGSIKNGKEAKNSLIIMALIYIAFTIAVFIFL